MIQQIPQRNIEFLISLKAFQKEAKIKDFESDISSQLTGEDETSLENGIDSRLSFCMINDTFNQNL